MKKSIIIVASLLLTIGVIFYFKRKRTREIIPAEKVLTIALPSQVKSIDPIKVVDRYSFDIVSKVYEGLLDYHYLKRPLELVPNLAEAMPDISADSLTYTFKIKKNVRFHDDPCFQEGKGRELNAYDFVYSFKRIADPNSQSLKFSLIDNVIKGINTWHDKNSTVITTDYVEEIEGIKALDKYTLQLILERPCPNFLYLLTMAPFYVVAREAVDYYGEEFSNHPVGTGPFILPDFKPQDIKIVCQKNPTFRDKFFPSEAAEEYKHMLDYAGKKLPFVDKVVSYILPEEQTQWLKFQKGELDIMEIPLSIVANILTPDGKLSLHKDKNVKFTCNKSLATTFVVFNSFNPLFKNNIKLRRAMSLAFDKKRYNELFHNSLAILAESILPPGLPGYIDNYINPYGTYDLQRAQKYLTEAGYPGGKGLPEITLDITSNTETRHKGEFFQDCMKKIGIDVILVQNIFPELLKKIDNNQTMLYTMGWEAAYPDAEIFFQILYGKNEQAGIRCRFRDAEFDSLYEKIFSIPQSPAKTKLYEQLNKIAAEKVPFIYVNHPEITTGYQGWIRNYTYVGCTSGANEQYVDIDCKAKATLLSKVK